MLIADALRNGAKTCEELAPSVGANPRALYRLLRALASQGVFEEDDQGRFTLTPRAEFLQTDVPGSLRSLAIALGEAWWWRPWGELLHSVETGKPAFEHIFGTEFFEYMNQNAEAAAIFNAVMAGGSRQVGVDVAAAFDFSEMRTVVDVGGGHGALLAGILRANPHLRGILFDLPSVVDGAKSILEAEGIAERCELVGGDFFESVPRGGDAYVLKIILHDWDDEHAVAILKNCHRAMEPQRTLLVVERPIPPGNHPFPGKYTDLNMLVLVRGRERTVAEYQLLFEAAGFRLTRSIPTPSEAKYSIIEGVRV